MSPRPSFPVETPPWHFEAACRTELWPDAWYPDGIPNGARDVWSAPRAVCLGCPVVVACLEAALLEETGAMRHGMRGGKTPLERHRIMANRGQQARRAMGQAS